MALEWREGPTSANQTVHESQIHRKLISENMVKPQVT